MARSNFEKNIKEQLDNRRIEPAANSWERLNAQLNAESGKPRKRKWRIAAAAAVVVTLVSANFVLDRERAGSPQIVEQPAGQEISEPSVNENHSIASEDTATKRATNERNLASEEKVLEKEKTNRISATTEAENQENSQNRILNEAVVLNTISLSPPEKSVGNKLSAAGEMQELFAAIATEQPGEVSDAELDALLAAAVNEIKQSRLDAKANEAEAMALLNDVENELERSFRDRVFEMLKEGYLKTRTAVANRNNE